MNSANLNVASSKMSAMLCCSGEKDSSMGRDLKSAQNTPSRQPMQPPYTMATGQFNATQPQSQQFNAQFRGQQPGNAGQQAMQPNQMFAAPGMTGNLRHQQQAGMPPNNNPMGMNNYGNPQHMGNPKVSWNRSNTFFQFFVFRLFFALYFSVKSLW